MTKEKNISNLNTNKQAYNLVRLQRWLKANDLAQKNGKKRFEMLIGEE